MNYKRQSLMNYKRQCVFSEGFMLLWFSARKVETLSFSIFLYCIIIGLREINLTPICRKMSVLSYIQSYKSAKVDLFSYIHKWHGLIIFYVTSLYIIAIHKYFIDLSIMFYYYSITGWWLLKGPQTWNFFVSFLLWI